MNADGSFKAGWYPDPTGGHEYRYHDGQRWTDRVSDAGSVTDEPLPPPPPPPPAGEGVDESAEGIGTEHSSGDESRSNRWVWVLAASAAAVVVSVLLVISRGGDSTSEPQVGTYAGGGDNMTISLVVAGDPPAVSSLMVVTTCGNLSLTQNIELQTPRPIEDGSFELFVPPPGGLDLDGTFVDDGKRVKGSFSSQSCSGEWDADFLGAELPGDDANGSATDTNPIRWETSEATLTADDFFIKADGLTFGVDGADVDVASYPSASGSSTTIKVVWIEHGREMRLYVYLASKRDGTWVAEEITVHDGTTDPEWVHFNEPLFGAPMGSPAQEEVFERSDEGVVVRFEGLRVDTSLVARDDDTSEPALEAPIEVGDEIELGDEIKVGDMALVLADAYFDCHIVEGLGALCPVDLVEGDQPLTIQLDRLAGDPAAFDALTVEIVDRSGRTYPVLSGTARVVDGETATRFATFGLPEMTDEVELVFGSSERFDLEGAITAGHDVDDGSAAPDEDGTEPARTFFRDDFDGFLATDWEWINEDPTHWSLDHASGGLSIVAQQTGSEGFRNILVVPMPEAIESEPMFLATTHVAFEPTSNFQFAGLMVAGRAPDSDRVQFGRSYCDDFVCAGDGVYFDMVIDGRFAGENFAIPFENTPELFLQLFFAEMSEGRWIVIGAFSFDGEDWIPVGEHEFGFEPAYVGLLAGQALDELTATFEFFEFEELPR